MEARPLRPDTRDCTAVEAHRLMMGYRAHLVEFERNLQVVQSWGGRRAVMESAVLDYDDKSDVSQEDADAATVLGGFMAAGACLVTCAGAVETINIGLESTLKDVMKEIVKKFPDVRGHDLRCTLKRIKFIEIIKTKDSDLEKMAGYVRRERVKSSKFAPPEVACAFDHFGSRDKVLLVRPPSRPLTATMTAPCLRPVRD